MTQRRPVEQIAAHALALQPAGRPWVVPVLREAALIAVRRGAADDALSYLRRALAEPAAEDVRPRLLQELGMSESLANEPLPAVEHLRAAYESTPDPAERAEIVGVLSRMLIFTNPPDDAVELLRKARAGLPPELGDLDDALAAVELYAVFFGAEDTDGGRRLATVQVPRPGLRPGGANAGRQRGVGPRPDRRGGSRVRRACRRRPRRRGADRGRPLVHVHRRGRGVWCSPTSRPRCRVAADAGRRSDETDRS